MYNRERHPLPFTDDADVFLLDSNSCVEPPAAVAIEVKNIPATKLSIKKYRIDEQASNAYTVWKATG